MAQTVIAIVGKPANLDGPSFDIFYKSLRTKATKRRYLAALSGFAKWRDVKNVEELLDGDPRTLSSHIVSYLEKLKDDGLSFSTRSNTYGAIRHFYEMNYVVLAWKKIYGSVGEYERKYDNPEPYTHEEITKLLDVSDIKYRALILLMVSSGIRVGAIPGLTVGNLEPMEGYEIYKVHIYRRSREEYYTFCTPECYRAINEYLEHRKRLGEEITLTNPLFRTDPNTDPRIRNKPHVQYKIKHASALKDSAIKIRLYYLLQRSGLLTAQKTTLTDPISANKNGARRNKKKMVHSLRKFFGTQLELSNLEDFHAEALLGHSTGLRAVYRVAHEKRFAQYLKAVNNLTINEENRLREELKAAEKQEDELNNLRQADYWNEIEISHMKEEIERLKSGSPSAPVLNNTPVDQIAQLIEQMNAMKKELAELKASKE